MFNQPSESAHEAVVRATRDAARAEQTREGFIQAGVAIVLRLIAVISYA